MSDEIEMLAKRLRETPDKPITIPDLAAEFGLTEAKMARSAGELMKRSGYYDLGGKLMFTGNADLAAFEILRNTAAHITFEEYIKYRDQPHILMRMSRDREVSCGGNHEELLKRAVREKSRGSSVLE
jgi:hypothetical protein